jgi:molybdopterin/thiamine biosynthesis adenylyltransferase
VLLLGAGGLGSPAALYLAAAGVGTLGIIDMDVVDASNLQRQILHNMDRIGDRKVDSAKKTLTLLNPDVNVVTYDVRLDAEQRHGHPRRLRRRRRRHRQLPHPVPGERRLGEAGHPGGARRSSASRAWSPCSTRKNGPTYRDMVPEPPPAELAPSCAEAGVLGVLPGIVGSIQAIETIKLILGLGEPLVGRLLAYDSLEQSFREFKVRVDPTNEVTYANRDRIVVAELEGACAPAPAHSPAEPGAPSGRPARGRAGRAPRWWRRATGRRCAR